MKFLALLLTTLIFTTDAGSMFQTIPTNTMYNSLMPSMTSAMNGFNPMIFGQENMIKCVDDDLCKAGFDRHLATQMAQQSRAGTLPAPAQKTVAVAKKDLEAMHNALADQMKPLGADCYVFSTAMTCNAHVLTKGCLWNDSLQTCGQIPKFPSCSAFPIKAECELSDCEWNTAIITTGSCIKKGAAAPTVTINPPVVQPVNAPTKPAATSVPNMNVFNMLAGFETEEYYENRAKMKMNGMDGDYLEDMTKMQMGGMGGLNGYGGMFGGKSILLNSPRYSRIPRRQYQSIPRQYHLQSYRPIRPINQNLYATPYYHRP